MSDCNVERSLQSPVVAPLEISLLEKENTKPTTESVSRETRETSEDVFVHQVRTTEEKFLFRGVRYSVRKWEPVCRKKKVPLIPCVLLHGFAQSVDSWNGVAGKLSAQRVVWALDLVGHGSSDAPEGFDSYTLESQGDCLRAFLAYVKEKEKQTPAVLGYSMGGRVALQALVSSPQDFSHLASTLMLEGVGLGSKNDAERLAAQERDLANAIKLRTGGLSAFMDAWEKIPLFKTQLELSEDVRKEVRLGRMKNDPEVLARMFELSGQHVMPPYDRVVEALNVLHRKGREISFIVGERDIKYFKYAQQLAKDTSVCIRAINGTGHNAHLERPNEFVERVQEALLLSQARI